MSLVGLIHETRFGVYKVSWEHLWKLRVHEQAHVFVTSTPKNTDLVCCIWLFATKSIVMNQPILWPVWKFRE